MRCPYCDFATAPYAEAAAERYVDAVLREAELVAPALPEEPFLSLFYGGGTPSRLRPATFERLARGLAARLRFTAGAERSLEANPEDVDAERLDAWGAAGIGRVSLGVQATDGTSLARLGRPHDPDMARAAAVLVASRFPNWSLDLLYGFPGHDEEIWSRSLDEALALGAPHLSLYHFTAEPGTVLGNAILAGRVAQPDGDAAARFLELAAGRLLAAGYEHYEISNFAKPGCRSRHNTLYWERADCLGLGPAAVSTWGETRWTNCRDATQFTAEVLADRPWVETVESLAGETMREIFLVGLRLLEGVPWSRLAGFEAEAEVWRSAAGTLACEELLVCDEIGVRVATRYRRLTDAIVLRLWTLAEAATPPGGERGPRG